MKHSNGPGLVFYNAVLCCAQWAQRVIQKRRVTFVQVNLHYSLLFERVATLGSRIMSSHIDRLESQFFFVQRLKYYYKTWQLCQMHLTLTTMQLRRLMRLFMFGARLMHYLQPSFEPFFYCIEHSLFKPFGAFRITNLYLYVTALGPQTRLVHDQGKDLRLKPPQTWPVSALLPPRQ